jgi:hypothetical protein
MQATLIDIPQYGYLQSQQRLAVSILMDINEEWMMGRKYLNLEES